MKSCENYAQLLSALCIVNGEPFSPKEAEFFLETATQEELGLLKEGGYDLPKWEG